MVSCSKKEGKDGNALPGFISAEHCVDCHEPIYDEWKESMHAKSSPMKDKLHAKVFKMTGNDIKTGTKDGKPPVCLNCHVPIAALDGEADLTKKDIYSEGITCTFCHKIKSLKTGEDRGLGAMAYEYNTSDGYAATVADPDGAGHAALFNPFFSKSEFCNGCHEKRTNSKGVNVCNTFEEFQSSKQSKSMKCQNCHMPAKDGRVASSSRTSRKVHFHGSTGGHNIEQVKSTAGLLLELNKEDNTFNVIVQNKNAAHKFPTAAPLRQLYVKVTQLDKNGKVIMENYKESAKEDKNALFVLAFKDADGNIEVPPWKAESIASDKRINPSGERIIFYDIAGAKVEKVRAELYYRLAPDELTKDGDFDDYTKKSHLIAEYELLVK